MKKALIVIVVGVAGFAGFIMTRPGKFNVERSTKIDATADVVFEQIADFHNWPNWSPWDKKEPGMKRTYSGSAFGVGAAYAWEGDDKTGSGNMAIIEAKPGSHVTIDLTFTKPYQSKNRVTFTLTPGGESTEVRWDLEGGNDDFMTKAMLTFMNMDKMIGPDFETGLKNLKAVSEAAAKRKKEAAAAPPAADSAAVP